MRIIEKDTCRPWVTDISIEVKVQSASSVSAHYRSDSASNHTAIMCSALERGRAVFSVSGQQSPASHFTFLKPVTLPPPLLHERLVLFRKSCTLVPTFFLPACTSVCTVHQPRPAALSATHRTQSFRDSLRGLTLTRVPLVVKFCEAGTECPWIITWNRHVPEALKAGVIAEIN